jgi:hypothetical protein
MNNSHSIINSFTEDFIKEFGEIKLRKVTSKIENSSIVMNYLVKLQEINTSPYFEDITATVMKIPYFMFAKKETIAMASLVVLDIWNRRLNLNNMHLSDYEFESLVIKVLRNFHDMV